MKFKIIILTSLFTFNFLLFTSPAYAQYDGIGEARIDASSPLYFLKSVREILELKFAGTTRIQAFRKLEFANRRIREVKSLAKSSRQDLIVPTLENYWLQLQELRGKANLKDGNTAEQISGTTALQMETLQKVYNQTSDVSARRSIRTIINRLSQWQDQLSSQLELTKQPNLAQQVIRAKLSGCNFLTNEASSSALNEIERAVLLERAQQCLNPKP